MTSLLQKGKDKVKTLYSENVYYSQDLDSDSYSNQGNLKVYVSLHWIQNQIHVFIIWLWRYSAIVCLKSSTVFIVLENQELFALEW